MIDIVEIYEWLYSNYGPQGWWPLLDFKGTNPTKTGAVSGYHIEDYNFPKKQKQRYEIILGAILTQNTNWVNVEKALRNLKKITKFDPKEVLKLDQADLILAIYPAGYYNQKSKYVEHITKYILSTKNPTREKLLEVKGVGPETADSILLYAYQQPEFVVDAYTKRIFSNLNLINEKDSYSKIKFLFEKSLPKDYKIYQEYHALIVEHAKRYYNKKPYQNCPLSQIIS
jgi:endonuclease-3 related protein